MEGLQQVLEQIAVEVAPLTGAGKVADYVPALACVPREKFGIAAVTLDGEGHAAGDASERFSIQSISKVYTLTLALEFAGEALWKRVGREPSGSAFNSLVQLEAEHGIPRNPFINAGAHVIADVVLSHSNDALGTLIDFVRRRAGNAGIGYDREVARSEKATGFRNAALANFLESFRNLDNPVEAVLDFYFAQCSIAMSCIDLARGFLFLANGGVCPFTQETALTRSQAKRVNALMLTCGTYDAAGDFAWAVWSPALNAKGNSLAGTAALEAFTTRTGISVF